MHIQGMHFIIIIFLFVLLSINWMQFLDLVSALNITLQPSGFDQNTVGQRQDVICSISVPPDVDPDTIELGWLNEDDIIINDSRVTIDTSSAYYNDSILITTIQFDPLNEVDENQYTCYAIVNGSFIFESIDLQNLTSKWPHAYSMYIRISLKLRVCI